jgi:hypothetical protein
MYNIDIAKLDGLASFIHVQAKERRYSSELDLDLWKKSTGNWGVKFDWCSNLYKNYGIFR